MSRIGSKGTGPRTLTGFPAADGATGSGAVMGLAPDRAPAPVSGGCGATHAGSPGSAGLLGAPGHAVGSPGGVSHVGSDALGGAGQVGPVVVGAAGHGVALCSGDVQLVVGPGAVRPARRSARDTSRSGSCASAWPDIRTSRACSKARMSAAAKNPDAM